MKRTIKIILPILLAVVIIACSIWYLFVYDRAFTRDVLLNLARYSEQLGNHSVATWFYNRAYEHAGDSEMVAIELAEQYKGIGNYTKAEFTLSNAIADGGGIDLYIALCETYVEQDKLLDAVNMLNNVTNPDIKEQLDSLRPAAPEASHEPGFYSQYTSVTIKAKTGKLYVSSNGQYPSTKNKTQSKAIPLKDGDTTIYAVAVAKNGLVSPMSTFGYTVGGVIEVVEFSDSYIEAQIRTTLGVSEDTVLYTNDLWNIKEFTVPNGAVNYADLKHMQRLSSLTIDSGVSEQLSCIKGLTSLVSLTITNTHVPNDVLAAIGTFSELQSLTLESCGLSDISELKKTEKITILNLSNNTISNISALTSMKSLESAQLQNNVIRSLAPISGNTRLTVLNVSRNNITSLAPLSALTNLIEVDASANTVSQLGKLSGMTALKKLNLASNALTDISGLSTCPVLEELNISSNKLSDISPLSASPSILYLDFSHNTVTAIPAFPKDCTLVRIDGSHNKISSLNPLSGLSNLNNVNMDYNAEISTLSPLTSCHNLVEVNVYATKVKSDSGLSGQGVIVNFNPVS